MFRARVVGARVGSGPHRRSRCCSAASSSPAAPVPRSIDDVPTRLLGYASELAVGHPGYGDAEYVQRRADICALAERSELVDVEYSEAERRTWAEALRRLRTQFTHLACAEYLEAERELGLSEDEVPQLSALSEALSAKTGWSIRAVGGLLHPRDFLNGLAFKVFSSTQYMRHGSSAVYTPEPDVIHEIVGHVPMFANEKFSDMVQSIGIASLGADEATLWRLTKIYWYTVEFGVVLEGDEVKAFGAGILSSISELANLEKLVAARRGELLPSEEGEGEGEGEAPLLLAFDPHEKLPKMSYKDGTQKAYFALESFADGAEQLRDFANEHARPDVLSAWRSAQNAASGGGARCR